jgi:hypothetical protein
MSLGKRLIAGGPAPYVFTGVTSGLVLHWNANASESYPGTGTSVTDLSPSNITGSYSGSLSWVSGTPSYWDFTGGGIKGAAPLAAGDDTHTLEVWIKCDVTSGYMTVIEQNANGIQYGGRSSILIRPELGGDYTFTGVNADAIGTLQPSTTAFEHIVMTINAGSSNWTAALYRNGSLHENLTVGNDINIANAGCAIGIRYFGGEPLNGKIGEARIYNKTLSSSEVSTNYNATKSYYGL